MEKSRKSKKHHKDGNGWIIIKGFGFGIGAASVIAWLFYRSFYAMGLCLPSVITAIFLLKRKQDMDRKDKMRDQFKEAMRIAADALEAGFSMEQAFYQVEKELTILYGEEGLMVCEIRHLNDQVKNKIPIETSLKQLAQKINDSDVNNLSRILDYARRSGGNYVQIIRNFVNQLDEKLETEKEIQANLAEKLLEQKVMCIMPLGIMALLNLQSGDFMEPLYNNSFGIVVMSLLLVVYVLAVVLGVKIMDIRM